MSLNEELSRSDTTISAPKLLLGARPQRKTALLRSQHAARVAIRSFYFNFVKMVHSIGVITVTTIAN